MKTQAVFVFLFWGLDVVLAQNTFQLEQFGVGMDLQLNPVSPPLPITSITWKYKGNIVAEWIKDIEDLGFLGILKDRSAKLDLTSGQLTIPAIKKSDEGNYTVEINNRPQSVGFTVSEVKPVPEPEVIVRPLTCNEMAETCKLSCEARSGVEDQVKQAEPLKFFWKEGDGEWKQSEKDKSITKSEDIRIKTFSCKMKNKISEKESPPLDNPFNRISEPVPEPEFVVRNLSLTSFLLSCEGDVTKVQPVQYFWKLGDGEWELSQKTITIDDKTQHVETVSCKIKNSVSEKESQLHMNLFFRKCQTPVWVLVMKSVTLLIFFGLIVCFMWEKQLIPCRCKEGEDNPEYSFP